MKNRVGNQVHHQPILLSTNCSNASVLYLINSNRRWSRRVCCKPSTRMSRTRSWLSSLVRASQAQEQPASPLVEPTLHQPTSDPDDQSSTSPQSPDFLTQMLNEWGKVH